MPGVPGVATNVPKRSTQRRRRNKSDGPVTNAVSDGEQRGPDLKGAHCAIAKRWYAALRVSGQSQFFEPSDWAAAELVAVAIDTFVEKPSAMMLASIQSASASLLVTEGDRRRLKVELERKPADGEGGERDVSWLDAARRRRDTAGAG